MAKGVFLTAPQLSNDDVTLTATSELGRRSGTPIPFDTNSGLLNVTAIGDPGDDLAHDLEIFGTQKRPEYAPLDSSGDPIFTDPETYATMAAGITVAAGAKVSLCAADDQLYAIVATDTDLDVYVWDGAAWTLRQSGTGLFTDSDGGLATAAIGQNIYICVADNTVGVVVLMRYATRTNTIGTIDDEFVVTTATVLSIACATDGAIFILLVSRDAGGGVFDVDIFRGNTDSFEVGDATITELFGVTWSASDDVRCPAITWNERWGFVAALRVGTASPAKLKIVHSTDGDDWSQITNAAGAVLHPVTSTPWATAACCGIAVENDRIYAWRATAATQDTAPTDVKMQWFRWSSGAWGWSAEVDVDGGVAVDSGTPVVATNWRGAMYVAWRSSSTAISIRKGNDLTATDTGWYREIRLGEPMFLAGLDDDSRTALFFIANGSITKGDKYRVPEAEYDYRVKHLLDDFMAKVWRGEENAEQIIQLDAGSGRAFILDAIAIDRSNLPSITVQLSDDVAFGSTSTDQEILATVQTPTVVSVDRNRILFADNTFREKQYAPGPLKHWITVSTGTLRILDNTHNALIVDGSAAGAAAAPATIFRDSMGYIFSSAQTPRRYLRLVTPTVELPDGYYEISRVLFGMRLLLPRNFSSGFVRDHSQIEATTPLKSGARFLTSLNQHQRVAFRLPWQVVELDEHLRSIQGLYGLSQGARQLVAFWPFPGTLGTYDDSGDQPDLYLGRFVSPLSVTQINKKFYSVDGAQFEREV